MNGMRASQELRDCVEKEVLERVKHYSLFEAGEIAIGTVMEYVDEHDDNIGLVRFVQFG